MVNVNYFDAEDCKSWFSWPYDFTDENLESIDFDEDVDFVGISMMLTVQVKPVMGRSPWSVMRSGFSSGGTAAGRLPREPPAAARPDHERICRGTVHPP